MKKLPLTALALAIVLAGCEPPDTTDETARDDAMVPATNGTANDIGAEAGPSRATANLRTVEGAAAGTAAVTAAENGIRVSLQVQGLPSGQHGAHVHMMGKCETPSFESAGEHWNPGSRQHGMENPQGPHAGDMPNLTIGDDGRGTLEHTLLGGTMEGLLDDDGSAMVIHTAADDQKTDPSGNSGARIACGVFSAG